MLNHTALMGGRWLKKEYVSLGSSGWRGTQRFPSTMPVSQAFRVKVDDLQTRRLYENGMDEDDD